MPQTWKSIKDQIEKAGVTDNTKIAYIDLHNTCCEDDEIQIIGEWEDTIAIIDK